MLPQICMQCIVIVTKSRGRGSDSLDQHRLLATSGHSEQPHIYKNCSCWTITQWHACFTMMSGGSIYSDDSNMA